MGVGTGALSAMEEEAGPFHACVEKSEVEGSDCLRDLMKRCIRTVCRGPDGDGGGAYADGSGGASEQH